MTAQRLLMAPRDRHLLRATHRESSKVFVDDERLQELGSLGVL